MMTPNKKKSGKKGSNYDSKKGKSQITKSATQNETSNAEFSDHKLDENSVHTKSAPAQSTPETAVVEPSKRYSKRNIQSNWEKYEIPEDSHQLFENAMPISYDYEFIQSTGGGVGSHFQLKDEKDWSEELVSDSVMNQLPSLDLTSLELSLSCIPFHQRLSIDPKYFTSEQIFQFEEVARLQEIKRTQKSLATEKVERKADNATPVQLLPSTDEHQHSKPTVDDNIPVYKHDVDSAIASYQTQTSPRDIVKSVSVNEMPGEDELEDELNALLALNGGKVQNMHGIEISNVTSPLENVHSTTTIDNPKLSVPEIAVISKDSLEDWLDSVLDD